MEKFQHLSSSSSTSSSSSLSSPNPSSIGVERWLIAEQITQEILSSVQPTIPSERRRKVIIGYVQGLLRGYYGIEAIPFGSVPLKTYLPDGDIDLTALSNHGNEEDLARNICRLLEAENRQDAKFPIKDVQYIPAQVKIVKCMVQNIAVDISFNQMAGFCALCFIEQVDQLLGREHLYKRSIILIKAWCYYESRILGAQHGLISTYALEILILYIINHFHSSLYGPLAVLYKFLDYYSTFDWDKYCISLHGAVVISSLPEIVVMTPGNDGSDLLLTEEFWKNIGEVLKVPTTPETSVQKFPLKHLNIMDPLKDDNNLGRSVYGGNFHRIQNAFCLGARKLRESLMLPEEELSNGIKKFFSFTWKIIRSGKRSDVQFCIPGFGASEVIDLIGDNECSFGCLQYVRCFHKYTLPLHVQPTPTSPCQVQNNGVETHLNKNLFPPRITIDFVPRALFLANTPQLSIVPLSTEESMRYYQFQTQISAVKYEEKPETQVMNTYINGMCVKEKLMVQGASNFIPDMGVEEKLMPRGPGMYISDIANEEKVKSRGTGTFIPAMGVDKKSKSKSLGTGIDKKLKSLGTRVHVSDPGVKENSKSGGVETYHPCVAVDQKAKSKGIGTDSADAKSSTSMHVRGRGKNGEPTTQSLLLNPLNPEQIETSSEIDKDGCSNGFNLSVEEFPLLPVTKKAIRSANSTSALPTKSPGAKESSPQLESSEFGKLLLSPTITSKNPNLSFSSTDFTPDAPKSTIQEPPESNGERVPIRHYKLEDDEDFPPLYMRRH